MRNLLSGRLVSAVLATTLSYDLKLLLVAIASYARDDGSDCFPGVALLAKSISMNERTVQRRLKKLEDLSLIEITENETGGRGKKRGYIVTLEKGDELEERVTHDVTVNEPQRVTESTLKGDRFDVKGDKTGSCIPIEPYEPYEPLKKELEKPPQKKPKKITIIDDEFRAKMRERFGYAFGNTVDERIDEALGHRASRKYTDMQAYVTGWLRRDAPKENLNGKDPSDDQKQKDFQAWINAGQQR